MRSARARWRPTATTPSPLAGRHSQHHPGAADRQRQRPAVKVYGQADPALSYTASGSAVSATPAPGPDGITDTRGRRECRRLCDPPGQPGRQRQLHDRLQRQLAQHHTRHAEHQRQYRNQGLWPGRSGAELCGNGLWFSDTSATVLTGSLTRAAGENVGSYAILPGHLAASSNYTIAFTRQHASHHAGDTDGDGEPAVEGLWHGRSGADAIRQAA